MLGLYSKGMNTIEMISYGWGYYLGDRWALSLTLGIKRELAVRPQTRQLPVIRIEQYIVCV